ncbi:NAD(P)/FAD-dependent oxidoreductase [Pseudomonas sp. L13]|uniref:phytoene desaturase family protein n=1 Tax=Pseudomonas sp. L13 TaxID=343985 RepID=UPI00137AEA36|nr:NAD(P)/FAD-dependent oxidoreductase [Pseudomonas sp. L13]NCE89431.1 FAD-dependent oxidoreductase [Pseudomonas sp. L13]
MKIKQSQQYDVIIVGSGINSLVCAAMLARAGRAVLVLEREAVFGGCIRSDELTLPGFLHDTLAMAFPLFVSGPAYVALGEALRAQGLEFCTSATPTGVLLPDGSYTLLSNSRIENLTRFERLAVGDGAAFARAMEAVQRHEKLVFPLMSHELWRASTACALSLHVFKSGMQSTSSFLGESMMSCRHWLEGTVKSQALRALLAPWTLHAGLGPDSAMSSFMTKVISSMLENVGLPVVRGGSKALVDALVAVIRKAAGHLQQGAHVQRVLVRKGRAYGVELADGRVIEAGDIVCSVTPTQLYGQLLEPRHVPREVLEQSQSYRYGKGNMQIHLALSAPLKWPVAELDEVTYIHLCDGPDSISRAINEADRGLLPAQPTICIAQPTNLDPSRAPAGRATLWIQLPACPRIVRGDAAGQIPVPADGRWTESLKEAYADRVLEQIARQLPGIRESVLARHVLSPADLEGLNVNLVGGDPYGGACELDQSMLWRPLRATRNHTTCVAHLWHIGASTHPGPGVGGVSGLHVAQALGAR